jgi:hypothetical protein
MVGKRFSIAGALVAAAVIGVFAQRGNSPSIVGVWKVSEITTTGPNARKIANPQPGLRIFTQRHYSISEVTSDKPRLELPPLGQAATDKQLSDAFGPFTGQAGTYEIKGNELTTRAAAAKSPNAMRAESFITSTFVLEGNSLTITTKVNATGPIANPTTTKYTRVE